MKLDAREENEKNKKKRNTLTNLVATEPTEWVPVASTAVSAAIDAARERARIQRW